MKMRCLAVVLGLAVACGKSSSKKDDGDKTPPPTTPPAVADAAAATPPPVATGPAGVVGTYKIDVAIPDDYTCRIKPDKAHAFEVTADGDLLAASGLAWEVAEVRLGARPGALTIRTKAPDDAAQLNLELVVAGADVAGVASFMVMDADAKCEIMKAAKVTGTHTPPAK
jgi:hypothetical protein